MTVKTLNPCNQILAIITARGGSKGVPRKNLRDLAGKPLVVWSIEAAKSAQHFMRILVTTDDPQIAEVSRAAGAEVPFLRPSELSGDCATSEAAVLHALDWLYEKEQYSPDLIVLLQPTSPFRSPLDIDLALNLQMTTNADSVISVTENRRPVQWLRKVTAQGTIEAVTSAIEITRRQDAEQLYQLNGAIYVIKPEVLRSENTFYSKNCHAYVMPPERSLDIDSELDFLIADLLMQHQLKG
jgi:CMP-N,N'-diacetyllegionaminic acid synthase